MNDWIVAGINNPTFSVSDFHDIANMDIANTLMKSKDTYLKSDYIKNNPLFLDNEGKFSEAKFDQFYDLKLAEYAQFQEGKYGSGLALDMFDTNRTADSKVRDDQFMIGRIISNPDRQKIGIEGINQWSTPEKSRSEIAQMNKIWDTEKGVFKDYSPNDYALFNGLNDYGSNWFKSLFEDPLVEAQWEEDGTHIDPISGLEVKHKKGDYKLNDKGTYYYETLGGRSPIGKNVLSALNTLTIDGTGINKYDFFDSDDIEKSVGGVIAKNIVALAPMFIGGPIGAIYSTALIAREMAKSLPMVYGVATALFGAPETPKWMNTIAAMGEKFTGGTSDYAKQKTFSFENFGNLISDVALQWGQLKLIANAMNKLRGSKNYIELATADAKALYNVKKATMGALAAADDAQWMNSALGQACLKKYLPAAEKAAKQAGLLGRDMSLTYMAIVSNSDVYADMLEHGASRQEAAAVALGSTLGMFAVDKTGLGEVFFDDATDESTKAIRAALKKEIRQANDTIFKQEAAKSSNKLLAYINSAAKVSKLFLNNYADDIRFHTTNALQKMGAEGIEEVSEELVADTAKAIYELAGKFGADTSVKDVGAWDNAWDRYTMSFLGGALGGGIFYGKEVWDGKSFKRDKSNEELATLIRNGHTDDIRSMLLDLKNSGKVGNTKLSGVNYELSENKPVWLSTDQKKESQNDVIANLIADKINSIDAIINNNQVGLNDELLFNQMVLGETRFARYLSIAPITNYYLDFNNVVTNLIAAELDLKSASKTLDGTVDGKAIDSDTALNKLSPEMLALRQQNIQSLLDKYNRAVLAKNDFLSGDTSLDYTRKLNFAIDPILHSLFLAIDDKQIWKNKFGDKNINDATPEELAEFMLEIQKAKQEYLKLNLTVSWQRFKDIEKIIAPLLMPLALQAPQFKLWREQFNALMEGGMLDALKLIDSYLSYEDLLPTESEEDYNLRNTKLIDPVTGEDLESDEEYIIRKSNRVKAIREYNKLRDQDWINAFKQELAKVGGIVDPLTYRKLIGYRVSDTEGNTTNTNGWIPFRARKIILDGLKYGISDVKTRDILSKLNNDLSNSSELIDNIKTSKQAQERNNLERYITDLKESTLTLKDGSEVSLGEYFLDNDAEWTLNDFIARIDPDSGNSIMEFEDETISDESIADLVLEMLKLKLIIDRNGTTDYETGDSTSLELKTLLTERAMIVDSHETSFDEYVNEQLSPILNEVNTTLQDIKTNPIIQLHNSLLASIKNPIVDLVRTLAGQVMDSKQIPQIESILEQILNDFNTTDDISSIILDDALINAMNTTKDILNMIGTYLYAASSTSDMNNIVGHNKVMNEYAKNHSNVVANWNELPEIDSDYAVLYQQELARYTEELNNWIAFSNNNAINKRAQFEKTDKAFSNTLWNLILKKLEAGLFTVNVDDKLYNLLEGISGIDTTLAGSDQTAVPLFHVEKLLYTNFLNALIDSGLEIRDFLKKSKLLDSFAVSSISNQKTSKFDDKLDVDNLTEYDKLQYLATVLTLNPVDFYGSLKTRVNNDANTAPITVQEYDAKLATASRNQLFRDIINYAHEISGDTKYAATNTTIITGAAGAGKTLAVIKSATQGLSPDEILAVGPTSTLAKSLLKSIGAANILDINLLMTAILGDSLLSEIKTTIDSVALRTSGLFTNSDNKFFTIKDVNGLALINLKTESIKYVDSAPKPKVLVIDEATHVPSLYIQILDNYMKSYGGQLLLVGDPNQRGYFNSSNGMGNLRESDIFAIRAPKLSVSLRDNNIQKQYNLSIVLALLDTVNDKVLNNSEDKLASYWPTAKNILSKFNFKVYNQEEINGDLITSTLSPEIIAKIKKPNSEGKKKSIGFIGNKNNSAAYLALVNSGLVEGTDFDALTMDQMQGLEFDYVVIDELFTNPDANITIRNFLLDLYTLMSRGREASIFIDNGLSSIIGSNRESQYMAKAPSLRDKINGVSAIDDLRLKKIEMLNKYDLTPITLKGEPKKTEPTPNETPINPEEDFINPDEKNVDDDLKKDIQKEIVEEIGESLSSGEVLDNAKIEHVAEELSQVEDLTSDTFSLFTVPSWGDVTYTGVSVTEGVKQSNSKGKEFTGPLWTIKHNSDTLRNLQALYSDGTTAFWAADKMDMQKDLYKVKSALIFQHNDFDGDSDVQMPAVIRNNFNKEDWDNGTYELEIRGVEGEVLPLFSPMPEVGFEYNSKRYIANIVFKVKNKKGQDCKFDLAGINNPNTLLKNLDLIKTNINNKINSGKLDASEIAKLKNIHDTIDTQATLYKLLFDSWIQEYENKGLFSINVTDATQFNKTTWFRRRHNNIRLGGNIDPNVTEDMAKRMTPEELVKAGHKNLKTMNPGMVFSDIYTYASKKNELEDIDPSVRGKAVVFVSSDTMLNPDDLVTHYILQKKDPKHSSPTVRMLVLDNYGMSFSQFMDPEFIKKFQGGDKDRKPLRLNFKGIQMFTALWNWRAGLNQFSEALQKWKAANSFTDEKVDKIIKADSEIFVSPADKDTILTKYGVSLDELNKLNTFNLEDLKNIPMFRLGYSNNGKGFHVQSYDVSGSTAYNKPKVNLLVITPLKANQFYQLTDRIIKSIVTNPIYPTLGVSLTKEDGTNWGENELIDLQNAKHKRTLAGLLKFNENSGLIIVEPGNHTVAFAQGDQWSMIPNLLTSIARTTTYHQYNDDGTLSGYEMAKVTLYDKRDNANKRTIDLQVGQWLKPSSGEPLLKTVFTNPGTSGHPDDSLLNMFDLIFHGTVEDFHKNGKWNSQKKEWERKSVLQMEDARFKYGFLVDPDVARKLGPSGDYVTIPIEGKNDILFLKLSTSDALFTSDVDLRSAGISLDLNKLLGSTSKLEESSSTEEEIVKETTFEESYPIAYKLITKLIDSGEDLDYTPEGILEAVEIANKRYIPAALNNFKSTRELNSICFYTVAGDISELNLLAYFLHLLGSEEFTSALLEDGNIIINNKYIFDEGSHTLKEKPSTKKSETSRFTPEQKRNLLNFLQDTSFRLYVIEESDDNPFPVDEETFNTFLGEVINILDLDGKSLSIDQVKENLNEIYKNSDYTDILSAINDKDESILQQLFRDC